MVLIVGLCSCTEKLLVVRVIVVIVMVGFAVRVAVGLVVGRSRHGLQQTGKALLSGVVGGGGGGGSTG